MPTADPSATAAKTFPCTNCGADLSFAPGTNALQCPYCGTANEIAAPDVAIEERDFNAELDALAGTQETYEVKTVHCTSCGAESTRAANVIADECPFCGVALVGEAEAHRLIKPQAVLPFRTERDAAQEAFRDWIRGLWFAPNDLIKRARRDDKLQGVYLPYWTYDAEATTDYRGRRGEYYYVTETYRQNGETKTRRVRKTRWYPASGTVHNAFDDILIVASDSLPRSYVTALEPWDLDQLVPYTEAYLSGFRTESYTVGLKDGFTHAIGRMQPAIDQSIRYDIGGDTQQILTKSSDYDDVTYKHVLLPLWISAYRYGDDVYRFMVNARTGEVQGERPWSWIKIALAVLAALIVAALATYFFDG
jgi:predicted RNA-binding Zn-ribbon protein involved in translation (DUF1610 family)